MCVSFSIPFPFSHVMKRFLEIFHTALMAGIACALFLGMETSPSGSPMVEAARAGQTGALAKANAEPASAGTTLLLTACGFLLILRRRVLR